MDTGLVVLLIGASLVPVRMRTIAQGLNASAPPWEGGDRLLCLVDEFFSSTLEPDGCDAGFSGRRIIDLPGTRLHQACWGGRDRELDCDADSVQIWFGL